MVCAQKMGMGAQNFETASSRGGENDSCTV